MGRRDIATVVSVTQMYCAQYQEDRAQYLLRFFVFFCATTPTLLHMHGFGNYSSCLLLWVLPSPVHTALAPSSFFAIQSTNPINADRTGFWFLLPTANAGFACLERQIGGLAFHSTGSCRAKFGSRSGVFLRLAYHMKHVAEAQIPSTFGLLVWSQWRRM